MENVKPGYYWASHGNKLMPLLWNGQFWIQHGIEFPPEHFTLISALDEPAGGCQTGCRCHQNPDGSWTIEC